MVAWATPDDVVTALGPGAAPDPADPWLIVVVDAANAAAYRKRLAAGYIDDDADDAPAPSPDIGLGTTTWAMALWRERASTETFASFQDLGGFVPTGGTWTTIKRLLGIGLMAVDVPASALAGSGGYAEQLARRRHRRWR